MVNIIIITVIVTLFVWWSIVFIVASVDEDKALYVGVGLVYPIVWVITYPIRANINYNNSRNFYKKHGISKVQYFFGKRVKE